VSGRSILTRLAEADPVLGLGNALVDVVMPVGEAELLQIGFPKGSMQLIDAGKLDLLEELARTHAVHQSPGGSAANTISALAALGQDVGFLGKVGPDGRGTYFEEAMKAQGIKAHLTRGQARTGCCHVLLTEDSERTFGTYLGAALELGPDDVLASHLEGFGVLHVEGYLVQNRALIEQALEKARNRGLVVGLDLASFNLVAEDPSYYRYLLRKYVDVAYANEDEAAAFTGRKDWADNLAALAEEVPLAVVKAGARGAKIAADGQVWNIPARSVRAVDTTGAGDYFAAGLYAGLRLGWPVDRAGALAAQVAGAVVQVHGTRLDASVWNGIRSEITAS